jgi:peroxiredoxin
MHRAWKQSVTAAALVATSCVAPSAWAFHAGNVFDKPPGAGGADGMFYAGGPAEHGWKCTFCHQNPPGDIAMHLDVAPSDLFAGFAYQPGQAYTFTATMTGGDTTPGQTKYNSIVVEMVDANGIPAGSFGGLAPDQLYQAFSPSTIASAGTQPNVTSWTFTWTAPASTAGADGGAPGPVTMYLAAVKGNGANSGPNGTVTDPFGDDFFSVQVPFTNAAAPTVRRSASSSDARRVDRGPRLPGTLACLVGLGVAGAVQTHRGRRRRRPLFSLLTCAALSVLAASCGGAQGKGSEAASGKNHPLIGMPAPEIGAEPVGGDGPKTLEAAHGKVVIVDFWGTSCEPCRRSFPKYQALVEQFAGDLAVIAVSVDEPDIAGKDQLLAFAKDTRAKFAIVWDKDHRAVERYGLRTLTIPSSFVIDKSGKVRHLHVSFHDGEEAKIGDEVRALLK